MKDVIILGGTGFIGRALARRLKTQARSVSAVGSGDFDLTNAASTEAWFRNQVESGREISHVFHLAAVYKAGGWPAAHPGTQFHANMALNLNALAAWKQFAPGARFTSVVSYCMYPDHDRPHPERELYGTEPESYLFAYAFTTKALLVGQRAYVQEFGFSAVSAVLPTVFGPGDSFLENSHVMGALIGKFNRRRERIIRRSKYGGTVPRSGIATLILWHTGGFPLATAFSWANIAWTGLFVYKNIASDPIQLQFLGLTDIPGNLATIVIYGGLSVAGICRLAAICQKIKLRSRFDFRASLLLAGALLLLIGAGLASYWLPWIEWGVTFPAWVCLALCISFRHRSPAELRPEAAAVHSASVRCLCLLASGALLARMCLNPRIYDYGFYQAALAGAVIVATGFRSLPDLFSLGKSGRNLYLASVGIFLAFGLWNLAERSYMIMSFKT